MARRSRGRSRRRSAPRQKAGFVERMFFKLKSGPGLALGAFLIVAGAVGYNHFGALKDTADKISSKIGSGS